MKKKILKILTEVSKGNKNPEVAQTELLNLLSVNNPLFSENEINKFADNYSQNWGEDKVEKSISFVSYKRGFKKVLRLIQE